MRSYPRNSPEAAARIVALALIADGHLCRDEVDAIDRGPASRRLNIAPDRLHEVVRGLCEDLDGAAGTAWTGSAAMSESTLAALLDEVDDPMLRLEVLQMSIVASTSDGRLAETESRLIAAAVSRWGLCGHASPPVPGERKWRN